MAPINVGIIGYGFAAKSFHIPFISAIPAYKIVAILQRAEAPQDPETAAAGSHCTVDHPDVKHYRTPDDFFSDAAIDLVVVATHHDTHALFAEKALNAGKHALVDKPFATSAEEADRVIKLAADKGLILTCYQNRRWDGDFQTLRHLVANKALGDIMEAEFHYDFESPPWLKFMNKKEYTPGSGMTYGLGTHSIDQAYTLFGRPVSVTAFYRVQRGIDSEVEDSFTIMLQYGPPKDQLLVTIKTAVTTPMAQQLKLLVRGTEGSFVKWQQRSTCPQEEHIEQGKKALDPGFGEEPESLHGVLTTYKEFDAKVQSFDSETKKYVGKYPTITGRWLGLYENVAGAVKGEEELEVQATQCRDVLRIIELARESHNKKATVEWK